VGLSYFFHNDSTLFIAHFTAHFCFSLLILPVHLPPKAPVPDAVFCRPAAKKAGSAPDKTAGMPRLFL
jgi:hypothetical protein